MKMALLEGMPASQVRALRAGNKYSSWLIIEFWKKTRVQTICIWIVLKNSYFPKEG
jgi:hypothetical protein